MKRTFKLSAEVSPEANDILVSYCDKHERSKGYLIEKMIRRFCNETIEVTAASLAVAKVETPKAPRSARKKVSYPDNLDDQFLMLWEIKGKKGSKKNAYNKFRTLAENATDEGCENFTQMLTSDILKRQHEIGVKEQHLITYLNKEEWDK